MSGRAYTGARPADDEAGLLRPDGAGAARRRAALPRRRGPGRIEWAQAGYTAAHDMLVNPTYAGEFAYGRRQSQRRVGTDGHVRMVPASCPRDPGGR